jgi:hypothetical protein
VLLLSSEEWFAYSSHLSSSSSSDIIIIIIIRYYYQDQNGSFVPPFPGVVCNIGGWYNAPNYSEKYYFQKRTFCPSTSEKM